MIYLISYLIIACLVFHLSAKYIAAKYIHDDFEFEDLFALTIIACLWPLMIPIMVIMEIPTYNIIEKCIAKMNKVYKKK